MSNKTVREAWDELDDIAAKAGGYVDYVPGRPLIIDADYRAMLEYCKKKGISSMDLTEEEYAMFVYEQPLIYGDVKVSEQAAAGE